VDDNPIQAADDLVTLRPDVVERLRHRIARLECAVDALLLLARRPYFSPAQKTLIFQEADELDEKDIEPLRAALRDEPLSEILQATVDELGEIGDKPV
jgi:hypothetical protein